jgi:hypothetical protein
VSPVAAVLDTSAVLAYAGGLVAVGELITMVGEEGRLCAVPASCLVAARAAVTEAFDVQQLVRLTTIASVAVLPLMPDEALEVGRWARRANGDAGAGHAAQVALTYQAYYATAEPNTAVRLLPKGWTVFDLTA